MSFRKSAIVLAFGLAACTAATATGTYYTVSGVANGKVEGQSFWGMKLEFILRKDWEWTFIDAGDDSPYTGYHLIDPGLPLNTTYSYIKIGGDSGYAYKGDGTYYVGFDRESNTVSLGTITYNQGARQKLAMTDSSFTYAGALLTGDGIFTGVDSSNIIGSSMAFETNRGLIEITSFSDVAFSGHVPEPSSFALAGLGLAGLAATARRRRK